MADRKISELDLKPTIVDGDQLLIKDSADITNKAITAKTVSDYVDDELGIPGVKQNVSAVQALLTGKADQTALDAHEADTDNPHDVTKEQVDLGNVDNTSDLTKPISTATQAALDGIPVVSANPGGTGLTEITTISIGNTDYALPEGGTVGSGVGVIDVSAGSHDIPDGFIAWVDATNQYVNNTGAEVTGVSSTFTFGSGWLKLGDGQADPGSGITQDDGDARYLQQTNNLNDLVDSDEAIVNLGLTKGSGDIITADERAKLDGIEEGAEVNVGVEFLQIEKDKLGGIQSEAQVNLVKSVTVSDSTTQEFNNITGALTLGSSIGIDYVNAPTTIGPARYNPTTGEYIVHPTGALQSWYPGISYEVDDLVEFGPYLYTCIQAHTSASTQTPAQNIFANTQHDATPQQTAAVNWQLDGSFVLEWNEGMAYLKDQVVSHNFFGQTKQFRALFSLTSAQTTGDTNTPERRAAERASADETIYIWWKPELGEDFDGIGSYQVFHWPDTYPGDGWFVSEMGLILSIEMIYMCFLTHHLELM